MRSGVLDIKVTLMVYWLLGAICEVEWEEFGSYALIRVISVDGLCGDEIVGCPYICRQCGGGLLWVGVVG